MNLLVEEVEKEQPNKSLMKSYVLFEDRWFYVSTIDRESSSILGPDRYSETLVWEYDMVESNRGDLIGQGESYEGSIREHLNICRRLFETGKCEEPDV